MAEAVLERQRAVARYLKGESATAICQSLGHSREWLYKWVKRQQQGGTGVGRRRVRAARSSRRAGWRPPWRRRLSRHAGVWRGGSCFAARRRLRGNCTSSASRRRACARSVECSSGTA